MKGKKSKKKIIITGIICLIAAALVIAAITRPKPEMYTEEVAKTQDIINYYSFSGNVESKDSQTVFSKSTLSIKTFHVEEGDLVAEGDLLFELDDSTIKKNLEQAAANVNIAEINYEMVQGIGKSQQMAQLESALNSARLGFESAQTNLERMTELYASGSISEAELEQAQTTYNNAKLSLDSAQKNYQLAEEAAAQNIRTAKEQLNQARISYELLEKQLEDTKIFAEISGEVAEIYVEKNSSMIMGTKIMDIVNYEDLEVTIKVDEYELGAVTTGEKAKIIINALDKEITGTVTEISRQAEVVNNVSYFSTSISLEKDESLRVGMSAEVKILNQNEKNVTTISMKALQFDNENKPFVYYRDIGGNVVTKNVTVGINDGNIVQILDGVKSGETILVPIEGIFNPMDMMRVRR